MNNSPSPDGHPTGPAVEGAPVETLAVDHGALTACPVWEQHDRGGNHYYLLPKDLRIGDAVEFAGDYVTSGGRRQPDRRYRVVTRITRRKITFACYASARQAIDAGAELVRTAQTALKATAEKVLAEANALLIEPGQHWYVTSKRFGPAARREGRLAEIRLLLLTDAAARAAGLLD